MKNLVFGWRLIGKFCLGWAALGWATLGWASLGWTALGWSSQGWAASSGAAPSLFQAQPQVIESGVLGEKRQLVIYLPAGYQHTQDRYPVLYLTDGEIQGPHTAGTVDYLAKFEQMPPMIVVGIINPPETRVRDLTVTPADPQNPQSIGQCRSVFSLC